MNRGVFTNPPREMSWGNIMENEEKIRLASRTPEQIAKNKANNNAREREYNAIRAARLKEVENEELRNVERAWAEENAREGAEANAEIAAASRRRFNGLVEPARVAPVRVAQSNGPKPRKGKVMRECRTSNVAHTHQTGDVCKFIHKDEPEYSMLRPEQKRTGGKSTRKASRKTKSNRKSKKGGASRYIEIPSPPLPIYSKQIMNGGRNIQIPASPLPLSKVNTYTSWPGGIDPTVPLYNQKTMLGGRKSRKNSRK
jgi:hypothetical protein